MKEVKWYRVGKRQSGHGVMLISISCGTKKAFAYNYLQCSAETNHLPTLLYKCFSCFRTLLCIDITSQFKIQTVEVVFGMK